MLLRVSVLYYCIIPVSLMVLALPSEAQFAIGDLEWGHNFGSVQYDTRRDLAIDTSNNVYVVGRFLGTVDFDPGPDQYNLSASGADAFVGKFDQLGNLLWAGSFGGPRISHGLVITVDVFTNIYTAGSYCSAIPCTSDFDPGPGTYTIAPANRDDIFICKLDYDGNFEWVRSFGGPGTDFVRSIHVDAMGDIYVSGYVHGVVDLDPGPGVENLGSHNKYYSFILKLTPAGDFLWARASAAAGNATALDNDGNVYTTGGFQSIVDFDPGPGVSEMTSIGSSDVFVSKLDPDGNLLWSKQFGGSSIEQGRLVHVDKDNFVYVSGPHGGGVDFDPGPALASLPDSEGVDEFLLKLDPDGNMVWVAGMGATWSMSSQSVSTDSAGDVYVTGYFSGTMKAISGENVSLLEASSGVDAFIYKFSNAGALIWASRFGGAHTDYSHAVVSTTTGELYLTGSIAGAADLAPGSKVSEVVSNGEADIFLAKVSGVHFDPLIPVPGVPIASWPLALILGSIGVLCVHHGTRRSQSVHKAGEE